MAPLPSSIYAAPQAARALQEERLIEERRYKKMYEEAVAKEEIEARQRFEADIYAQMLEARQQFGTYGYGGWAAREAKQARLNFEKALATRKAQLKQQYEAQISASRQQYQEALGYAIQEAKKQAAMQGKAFTPRMIEAYRKGEMAEWEAQVSAGTQVFEQQLADWEKGQRKLRQEEFRTFASQERLIAKAEKEETLGQFETALAGWEKQARGEFEAQVTSWKVAEAGKFEAQLAGWRAGWQPKGLAERMMEVKVPSLDLAGYISGLFGQKPLGISAEGIRLGDILVTSEGAKPFKAEVRPLEFPAGIVGGVESFAYGVAGLAGVPTPRVPPSLAGGFISSAILSVQEGKIVESAEMKKGFQYGGAYLVGTAIGDILVGLGISKATQVAAKGIKGLARFVYRESGLKYSHAMYRAAEVKRAILGKLPKSPLQAIRQSHEAYTFKQAISKLPRRVKYAKEVSEGIIGFPTVPEAEKKVSYLVKGSALMSADDIKWLPRMQAGMDLFEMTVAPRTMGLGLTVGKAVSKVITKTALSEALAETMWLGVPAAEKWMARAGILKESWIVQKPPTAELGAKIIKGGREITLSDALGFTRLPKTYRAARAGQFFFEKEVGKLPSLKDLLKSQRAEATLAELISAPSFAFEAVLPKISMLPAALGKVSPYSILGASAVLISKPIPKKREIAKPMAELSPIASEILKPSVQAAVTPKAKMKEISLLKSVLGTTQIVRVKTAIPSQLGIIAPPLKPRKEEEKRRIIKRKKIREPYTVRQRRLIYPVVEIGEAAKYVLGKKKRK